MNTQVEELIAGINKLISSWREFGINGHIVMASFYAPACECHGNCADDLEKLLRTVKP